MGIRPLVGTVLAIAVLAGAADADGVRYRVRFGQFPALEVSDSARISPYSRAGTAVATVPAKPARPVSPLEPVLAPPAASAAAVVGVPADTNISDLPIVTGTDPLPAGEPPAAFTDYIRDIYGVTDAARVEAIWRIAREEPKDLPENARFANGVIRWALQNPGKLGGASTADLDQPAPTRVIVATGGVSVRSAPWGPIVGSIPSGAQVRVVGREGIWVSVESAGTRGWVSGLWTRVEP